MNLLTITLTVLSISILFFSAYKPKIGTVLYLIYMYMAPYLYIGGFIIYARSTAIIFLILFLFLFGKKMQQKDYTPFMPYITFLGLQLVLLFTSEIFIHSLNAWFTSCSTLFFILFLYGNIKTAPQNISLYSKTLFFTFCIITLYGLFLTTMPGFNPYQMMLQPIFGGEFNEAYAAGQSGLSTNTELIEGRLFGRISSVFSHPMAYGLNLGFFFIYCMLFLRNNPKLLITISILIFIAILTSGTRTPLVALAITSLIIIFYLHRFKYFIYGLIAFLVIWYGIPTISTESGEYIASIINPNDSNTQGSSLSMRLGQLQGCLDIIKYDWIFGKGYGWSNWYNITLGTHPKALWFESIIFTILVNTGICGFVIWAIFIRGFYVYAIRYIKDRYSRIMILSLLIYFLVYCTITGDFGINYMFIFYTIMLGMIQYSELEQIPNKEHTNATI